MQTRLESLIESLINVGIGFFISFFANIIILRGHGYSVSAGQAFSIGVFFTIISVARSYIIRRWAQAYLTQFKLAVVRKLKAAYITVRFCF